MESIENLIGENFNNYTSKIMKRQNVPRKNIVDGIKAAK